MFSSFITFSFSLIINLFSVLPKSSLPEIKKICTRHPEGFATEETARFDIAWPEEPSEELKESTEEKKEIKINTD